MIYVMHLKWYCRVGDYNSKVFRQDYLFYYMSSHYFRKKKKKKKKKK